MKLRRWRAAVSQVPREVILPWPFYGRRDVYLLAYMGDNLLGFYMKRQQLAERPGPYDVGRLTQAYSHACSNKVLSQNLDDIIPDHGVNETVLRCSSAYISRDG
jgi:hypothetical protein